MNREFYDDLFSSFLLMCVFLFIFISCIQPAYLSYSVSCGIINDEELSELGYSVAGQVSYNISSNNTQVTFYSKNINIKDVRHEICHIVQYESGRIYGCNKPFRKFLSEVECYALENIPFINFKK